MHPQRPSSSRLKLFKYNQAGMSTFKIDKLSDDDEFEESNQSSDYDSDTDSISTQETESSSGPAEVSKENRAWSRMRPTLGLHAQSRRYLGSDSKVLGTRSQNVFPTYDKVPVDDTAHLYSRIDRRARTRPSRGLTMIEELSPIRSDSPSTTSDVPPLPPSLRLNSEWHPQLTSTTTSFQPLIPMPKTNPHMTPKFLSSTPRAPSSRAASSRAPSSKKSSSRSSSALPPPIGPVNFLMERADIFSVDSEWETPSSPWMDPAPPNAFKSEHFGLPGPIARNMGINGIVFLNMTICGHYLNVNVQKGVYFRDASQSQVCSYLRAELRHRVRESRDPKRHCSSSSRHHRPHRYEETYRTRLIPTTNRPTFQETFKFTLPSDCEKDLLVISVYAMNAEDTQRKKLLGCMSFPIRRLMRKAREVNPNYFYLDEQTENQEEVEINSGGFFLLSPKYGEKRNLPQNKINIQTFYNDPGLSGMTTTLSSITSPSKHELADLNQEQVMTTLAAIPFQPMSTSNLTRNTTTTRTQPRTTRKTSLLRTLFSSHRHNATPADMKMTSHSSRLSTSVPNDLQTSGVNGISTSSNNCLFSSSGDVRIRANPHHLDYTSASSSTNNSSADLRRIQHQMQQAHHLMHRATLPSITTTNTTAPSDQSEGDAQQAANLQRFDQNFLRPESRQIHGGSTANVGELATRETSRSIGASASGLVRRAASFTFSPRSSSSRVNGRNSEEKRGGRFFGPISKTISYLKSKMDIAMSSSSVFPTLEEVQRWKTDFPALLNNKYGCALFRQFLKKEFSDENVEFWLECEEFKKMKDGKKSTAVKAFEIYKEFVVEQASKEVNLDSDTRAATKAAVEDGSKLDMFNLAQSKVEQLMSKDSYRRFLKDRLYLDLLESFDENGTSSFDKK